MKILTGFTAFAATLVLCGANPVFAEPFNDQGVQYTSPTETIRVEPRRHNTVTYNARYGRKPHVPVLTAETDSGFNDLTGNSALPVDESRRLQRSRRCNVVENTGFNERDIVAC